MSTQDHTEPSSTSNDERKNKWTPSFDDWKDHDGYKVIKEKIVSHVLETLVADKSATVMDFGAGPGFILRELLNAAPEGVISEAVGSDVEQDIMKYFEDTMNEYKGKSKWKPLLLTEEDGSSLKPFQSNFDYILCTFVLGHIRAEMLDNVIQHLLRSLKSGGKILVVEFDRIGERHDHKEGKHVNDGGHIHTNITPDQLRTCFSDNDCKVIDNEGLKFDFEFNDNSYKCFGMVAQRN